MKAYYYFLVITAVGCYPSHATNDEKRSFSKSFWCSFFQKGAKKKPPLQRLSLALQHEVFEQHHDDNAHNEGVADDRAHE